MSLCKTLKSPSVPDRKKIGANSVYRQRKGRCPYSGDIRKLQSVRRRGSQWIGEPQHITNVTDTQYRVLRTQVMLRKMGEVDVKLGLQTILSRIDHASKKRSAELQCVKPRLVAVSKTKPSELIIQAYEGGQRHFGENYVQELIDKATNQEILEKCRDIRWHFIGHLQTNKVNKVLALPNLYLIETVDSKKLATVLNQKWPDFGTPNSKLKVMLQVNTSGEEAKSGIQPSEIVELAKYVNESCNNLELDGIMTIGRFGYNPEDGPNPDFVCLKQCRDEICQNLGMDWKNVNLSMGMSDDFEHAIEMGSTNIRVGSSIFGHRPPVKAPS